MVNNNGFNPQWNEKFQFHSLFPELAILRFVVMDNDTLSDDFIGQFSLPLSSLALGQCVQPYIHESTCLSSCILMYIAVYPLSLHNSTYTFPAVSTIADYCFVVHGVGYRHVHLLSDKGEPLDQATIFVHIACENPANAFYKVCVNISMTTTVAYKPIPCFVVFTTYACVHTCMDMHTRAHARTQTHRHTYTCMCTQTHILILSQMNCHFDNALDKVRFGRKVSQHNIMYFFYIFVQFPSYLLFCK